jgi:hypothetical protein
MPPYTPVVSKAQGRKLFSLVRLGEMSATEARGKVRAANWSKLPQHVSGAKRGHSSAAVGHPHRNLGPYLHKAKGGR